MFFTKLVSAIVLALVAHSEAFVYNVNVVYGDNSGQQPANSVKELTGQNNDINFQYGGKYVWLTPAVSDNTYATGFSVIIQGDPIPGLSDLAKGAGGDYRYLIPTTNLSQSPINQLALYRTGEGINTPPAGWRGMTGDINAKRGKTYLYLLWA